MTNRDFLAKEIFSRYGTVQRARGCFLYTKKGVRLTDLYQEGGRAILGWGSGSSSTVFKNTLNRHITGFFNTEFEAQTKKAVETLFCSPRTIFFYNNYSSALSTALAISKSATFFLPSMERCNRRSFISKSNYLCATLSLGRYFYIGCKSY